MSARAALAGRASARRHFRSSAKWRAKARPTRAIVGWLAAAICVAFASAPAEAQPQETREAQIEAADRALRDLRVEVERGAPSGIADIEAKARRLLNDSRAQLPALDRDLREARERLDQLGPAPKEGEPPEAESLAQRRAELSGMVRLLEAQRSQIVSNADEAADLLADISGRRLALLYSGLAKRGPSILSPRLWGSAAREGRVIVDETAAFFERWASAKNGRVAAPLAGLLGALVLTGLAVVFIRRRLRAFRAARSGEKERAHAAAVAGVVALAPAALGAAGGGVVVAIAGASGLVAASGALAALTIWAALLAFLAVLGFADAALDPGASKTRAARVLLLALAGVFATKIALVAAANAAGGFENFRLAVEGAVAAVGGALLFLLCRQSLWRRPPEADAAEPASKQRSLWPIVRGAASAAAAIVVAASLFGFIRLADFVGSRIYLAALILAAARLLRALLRAFADWTEQKLRHDGKTAEEEERRLLSFWFGAGVDVALFLALIPAALVLAGFDWRNVVDVMGRAFAGLRIGGVEISVSEILIALGVFFLILTITRLAQGGLKKALAAHARLDVGVQASLTTLLGYLGVAIALFVGITALGIDLSSLALIAGALSVGIGLGLQGIVNNFVSGLVLLFERPIKVGDWIVTQSGEGIVRRIGVRSTDIETFDRSSIIVPNSELVTQTVTNWTHRDRIGRITIKVGVSYDSDPELVRDTLLKCAAEHALVVRYPEPFVVWTDFGDSALLFELRCFLRDVRDGLKVRTDLRFAIFRAFREAGIEIPFPQRDIHIKSSPDEERPKVKRKEQERAEPPAYEPEVVEDD